ncbi:MAG: hypothetical protein K8R40_08695 [Anaerolineaceae bacterium]|nr:hypothetical protein [Anaerolineaceae bacterium]
MDFLAQFWDDLLSQKSEQIEAAWRSLDQEYHKDVRDHLCRMVMEEDWHLEQIKSAQAALDVIDLLKE